MIESRVGKADRLVQHVCLAPARESVAFFAMIFDMIEGFLRMKSEPRIKSLLPSLVTSASILSLEFGILIGMFLASLLIPIVWPLAVITLKLLVINRH